MNTTVIRSAEYGAAERRLMEDPIVVAMALEIPDHYKDRWYGGIEFSTAANNEYRRRGGTADTHHIGAVKAAIIALKGW